MNAAIAILGATNTQTLLSRVALQRLPPWFNLSNGSVDVSNG